MLTNASLTAIAPPPASAPGGGVAAYVPVALATPVRCLLDEPTFVIQRQIDQLKLDSTAVLFVEIAAMPTAPAQLVRNAQVSVTLDSTSSQVYRIDHAQPFIFGGISHVQCFLREI